MCPGKFFSKIPDKSAPETVYINREVKRMKRILLMLGLLALILAGCGKDAGSGEWDLQLVQPGDPDVYTFRQDDLIGLADAKKRVLLEAQFEKIDNFDGDYAVVCKIDYTAEPVNVSGYNEYPRLYGLINRRGEIVVETEYESMIKLSDGEIGPVAMAIYNKLTGIQRGTEPDLYNWIERIN